MCDPYHNGNYDTKSKLGIFTKYTGGIQARFDATGTRLITDEYHRALLMYMSVYTMRI